VIQDPDKLKAYAIDGKKPKAIVFPNTIDEVSKIVNYANQEHLAIIPRGNGTKMGLGEFLKRQTLSFRQAVLIESRLPTLKN